MKDFKGVKREWLAGHYAIACDDLAYVIHKHTPYLIEGRREYADQICIRYDGEKTIFAPSHRFLYYPHGDSESLSVDGEIDTIIDTIDELMHSISYSWDHTYYPETLRREGDGLFHVGKLTISPFWTEYKGQYERLKPGIYEALCEIYEVIEKAREKYGKPKKFDGSEVQDG